MKALPLLLLFLFSYLLQAQEPPSLAKYGYSSPPIEYLEKLTVPVLVCYGTKDVGSASFNDYFRIDMIRRKKINFSFKTYIGTEHNYFYLKPDGSLNYDIFNWDRVAVDWYYWLRSH